MPTPNLALPFIIQGQAQKEVTHNEALLRLDALVQIAVRSRSLAAPPGSPVDGERWIVAASPTGAWAGQANRIAAWQDGAWAFFVPASGWRAQVEDERLAVVWQDGAWRDRIVGTANGGAIRLVAIEQELTLTGAFVDATTAVIADRMIVLAVASRTTQAITGATSYSVGVAGNTSQFGGSLGLALGSSNVGVIGPTAFYSNTPIRVTAAGGNFTGGNPFRRSAPLCASLSGAPLCSLLLPRPSARPLSGAKGDHHAERLEDHTLQPRHRRLWRASGGRLD